MTRSGPRPGRRLPFGAEVVEGGVEFVVWAPEHRRVEVLIEARDAIELAAEGEGLFRTIVKGVAAGARYRLRADGGPKVPDPASRFQPEGPHGPSQVIDPSEFTWTDAEWGGVALEDAVIYELHVGAFTTAGTFAAASAHLPELADLGVTVVELLPLADFPGAFGWGYDGVDLFAPTRLYGRPDDLRAFVDRAHALGIAVILDVVYNHLGPDGCYLAQLSKGYVSRAHRSDWGDSLNFDEDGSDAVREFVLANTRMWIDEYHLDGLRLDATQQVHDDSAEHILAAITREVRAAAPGRTTLVIAENEPQDARLIRRPEAGGYGMDAMWNDDLHHAAMVALTGLREAYYSDYLGSATEFVAAARRGFLYQGQNYPWQEDRRGSPALDLPPSAFVTFLQNHDQIANSLTSERMTELAAAGLVRAMTAFVLLAPGTPMLFMGQEFGATTPFRFFADHSGKLAADVHAGRRGFLSQFPSYATREAQVRVPDPADPRTFAESRLDHRERDTEPGRAFLALHRDLLRMRRETPAIRRAAQERSGSDAAVLTPEAFVVRFFDPDGPARPGDRLLLVNLGASGPLAPAPEPLLAPPDGRRWRLAWSSDAAEYGGTGPPEPEGSEGWLLPGRSAVLLEPAPHGPRPSKRQKRQRKP